AAGSRVGRGHAAGEVVRADPLTQTVVVLQRSARRADADDALGFAEHAAQLIEQGILVHWLEHAIGLFHQRLARTVVAGRVTGAEAAAIAQEIAIDLAVIAVVNAPENALARADAGVAAQRTVAANAGRVLHVPFAHVLGVQGFIGEDAGRADFFQIAGKLVFER